MDFRQLWDAELVLIVSMIATNTTSIKDVILSYA